MTISDKATATGLKEKILTDDAWTIGALIQLYQHQEPDEQAARTTGWNNKRGFNSYDAQFLTKLAQQYLSSNYLTQRQIIAMRPVLTKYTRQLESYSNLKPLPNGTIPARIQTEPSATLDGNTINVRFDYDAILVDRVKTLSGRRWNSEKKLWTVPVSIESTEMLKEWGFKFNPALTEWLNTEKAPAAPESIDLTGLNPNLYPFQKEGVKWLHEHRGRGLIGDDMGLGKTVQALTWLELNKDIRPAIIVVPASVKLNWEREARKWTTDECIQVINGTGRAHITGSIIIINYDILVEFITCPACRSQIENCRTCRGDGRVARHRPDLPKAKAVILDEAHAIKNKDAQRTQAVFSLCKDVPHVIALTGTPILSRPSEIYNAISLLKPNLFPNFFRFAKKYCGATHNGFGWNFGGASNTKELHDILVKHIMLRRLKTEVLKDLPTKMRSFIPVELENESVYKSAEADFIGWLQGQGRYEEAERASNAETLTRIEGLKQLAVKGKMNGVFSWINEFLESGKKLVVFAVHKEAIDLLMEYYKSIAVKIDGSTAQIRRQDAVDEFQTNPDIQLFVGNIQAAGIGITLTAADSVAFIELGWTPGTMVQAEDRIHRIGQEAESVTAYYLLANGTIEEEIAIMLDNKTKVLSQVLDGQEVNTESLLMELVNRYSK